MGRDRGGQEEGVAVMSEGGGDRVLRGIRLLSLLTVTQSQHAR